MGDSLDLGRLADNLPSSNGRGARAMQAAEADLQSAFRNSALCITQMLKAGQKASKRSYQAGYSTALQDVLEYLQASLDVNVAQQRSNEGIAQVIDYIEARQEAVRLELQDIEADEEQQQSHQHGASPHPQQPVNAYHQQSSQSFRSHPHLRQHQEQQHSSTAYRQPQQPSYQPLASTSGQASSSSSHSAATAAAAQRKQRSSGAGTRSLSPVISRTLSSASVQQAANSRALSSSSASPLHHQRVNDVDAERTQESIPLASSSSIPNSPEARFAPDLALPPPAASLHATEVEAQQAAGTTPPPSTTSLDAGLSNASTAVSPLTRLQAKRERERHHDRRSRTHGGHHASHDGGNSASQGSNAATAAGVKRRWTAALLPEHHTINLSMNFGNNPDAYNSNMGEGEASEGDEDDEDEQSNPSEQGGEQRQRKMGSFSNNAATAPSAHEDDTGMEMDDTSYRIDGNARPMKRTARR